MSASNPTVVAAEQAQRAEHVAEAIHSTEMERLQVAAHTRADMDDYVAGQITADELVARGRSRYGLD